MPSASSPSLRYARSVFTYSTVSCRYCSACPAQAMPALWANTDRFHSGSCLRIFSRSPSLLHTRYPRRTPGMAKLFVNARTSNRFSYWSIFPSRDLGCSLSVSQNSIKHSSSTTMIPSCLQCSKSSRRYSLPSSCPVGLLGFARNSRSVSAVSACINSFPGQNAVSSDRYTYFIWLSAAFAAYSYP